MENNKSNQTQDSTLSVQSALVGKLVASYLVPDYMEGQKLAIVDEDVLNHLRSLLETASAYEIVTHLIEDLEGIKHGDYINADTLTLAVARCRKFVSFHQTVNLMKRYFDPKTVVTMEEPFNKGPEAPKPLTLAEMKLKSELMQTEAQELYHAIQNHPDNQANMPEVVASKSK